jgi:sugar phosphate isomerase/epimerase
MNNRREFMQVTVATLAALAGSEFLNANAAAHRPIGAQLYTVRDQAERDLPTVLERIRKIGYQEVEPYWTVYTHPAPELKKMINDHGLRAPSGHFNYEKLDDSSIEYAKTLGLDFLICPMLPNDFWTSLDGFKRAAEFYNKFGEKVHQAGMKFGHHNHDYEFRPFGGVTGFETLLKLTDPNLVCLEMDCYWVTQAGQDPLQLLKQYPTRIKLLHLKDRKPGFPPSFDMDASSSHFTEVGAGTVDCKDIIPAAEAKGVRHFFVERDSGDLPPFDSLKVSFDNLQKIA